MNASSWLPNAPAHASGLRVRMSMDRFSGRCALLVLAAVLCAAPVARADTDAAATNAPPADAPAAAGAEAPVSAEPAAEGATAPEAAASPEGAGEPAADVAKPAEPAAPATPPGPNDLFDPISGVKLGSSGQRQNAHIVIRRTERAEGKQEFALGMPVQVNGKFTEHLGTSLDWSWHLREAFAITAGFTWYVRGVQSAFTDDELIKKAKQQPLVASAILQQWDARFGLELQPFYGKVALFNSRVLQFGVFIGTSAGLTQTRVQLRPADPTSGRERTFGDTGYRPAGLFNVGFRFYLGQHIALKLELRDTILSNSIETINGCTANDLKEISEGRSPGGTGCQVDKFPDKKADGFIAQGLIKDPSSDIINNVAFVLGVAVLF